MFVKHLPSYSEYFIEYISCLVAIFIQEIEPFYNKIVEIFKLRNENAQECTGGHLS